MPNPLCSNQTQVHWNGTSFFSATAFFSDAALTVPSPDGWYAFGGMIRQILNGVLLSAVACDSCVIPCGDPITFNGGSTGQYAIQIGMGTNAGAAIITFSSGLNATTFFPVPDQCTWEYDGVSASEYSSLTGGYLKGLIGSADGMTYASSSPCFSTQTITGPLSVDLGSDTLQSFGDIFIYDISTSTFPNTGATGSLGNIAAPIGWTGLTNNAGAFQSTLLNWNCSNKTTNNCGSSPTGWTGMLGVPASPYDNTLPLAPNLQPFSTGGATQWSYPGNETRNAVMVVPSPPGVTNSTLKLSIVGPCTSTWWGIDITCPEPLTPIASSLQFGDLEDPSTGQLKTPIADVSNYSVNTTIYHVPVDAWGNTNPNSSYFNGGSFPVSPANGQPKGVLGLSDWVFEDENGVTPVPVGVYKMDFDALDGLGIRSWAVQVGPREYKDVGTVIGSTQINSLPPEDYIGQTWGSDWAGGITSSDVQLTGDRVPGVVRSITPCPPSIPLCNIPGGFTAISGSIGRGKYNLQVDVGATTGAVIIRFNPGTSGVSMCTWTYNGQSRSEYSRDGVPFVDPDTGYLSGLVGYGGPFNGGASTSCSPSITNLNGSSGATYDGRVYDYVAGSFTTNGIIIPNLMGPYANQASGETSLTVASPGWITMVAPKPSPASNIIDIQIESPCTGSVWELEVNCPSQLNEWEIGEMLPAGECGVYTTVFYTAATNTSSGGSSFLSPSSWAFWDVNGVNKLPAGVYPARTSVAFWDELITVDDNGIITNIVVC
tara:strand:+ start:9849 stop:12155 length:2307 start_codon:yes stop_codon:yes gene_type:complete